MRGVYFLADDRVINLAVTFLNSFRHHNPGLPLCLIPFNSNTDRLKQLQNVYGFSIYSKIDTLRFCDETSLRFHDKTIGHYRKLAMWDGDFDEFVYFDLDTVVLHPVDFVFKVLPDYGFITGQSNSESARRWVWQDSIFQTGALTEEQIAYGANTGFIVSRKGTLTLDGIKKKVEAGVALAPHMTLFCMEQPFLNYLIVTSGYTYTSLRVLRKEDRPVWIDIWAGEAGFSTKDGQVFWGGQRARLLLMNWAGEWQPLRFDKALYSFLRFLRIKNKNEQPVARFFMRHKKLWMHYHRLRDPFSEVQNKNPERRYRARPFIAQPISKTQSYIFLKTENAPLILHPILVSVLSASVAFQSLEERARGVFRKAGFFEKVHLLLASLHLLQSAEKTIVLKRPFLSGLVAQALEVLVEKGFFVSQSEFAVGAPSPTPAHKNGFASIRTVGIVTCDRVSNLKRALTSYIENARTHGKKPDFAIFDDAKNRDALAALKEFKKTAGVPLFYAGRQEKEEFIAALLAKGIPKDVLDFCLFGLDGASPTMGANRNAFLLHTVGELAFAADDDTVCRVFRSPGQEQGLRIGFEQTLENVQCYTSLDEALSDSLEENVDLLGVHEESLALDVQAFLKRRTETRPQDDVNADLMDARMMERIRSGEARTVVSLNGSLGDSGAVDPTFLFYLENESRERFLQSEDHFASALESRQIIRSVNRSIIMPAKKMISMFFGLNNTELLPPFFPVFRSEDTLFGMMVQDCVKGAFFSYAPWLLLHLPDERRNYSEPLGTGDQIRPCDVIAAEAFKVFRYDSDIPTEERLRLLGNQLKRVGALTIPEFMSELKTLHIATAAGFLQGMTSLLERFPKSPSFWKKEIEKRVSFYEKQMAQPHYGAPPFLTNFETHRRLIALYGELLVWWPEIVLAAKELKKQGRRLAQPV